jgi:methionyl-tRNA synthetase
MGEPLSGRFYITTAIDYSNGPPHLGHAYEKVLADAIARFHRQQGHATWYLTGTDEHGQKIMQAAAAAGETPAAFVTKIAQSFKDTWQELRVEYDQFIRTTDPKHEDAVRSLYRRLMNARSPKTGQPVLFEKEYEGLYCDGCEEFKQERDLDEAGRCPIHLSVPKRVQESNWFLRMSEYDDALLSHIERHPEFIQPEYRRNEVVNVIKGGLLDVSMTRRNVPWGVVLPADITGSEGHTAYVWGDALLNYLSAIGWPDARHTEWWLAPEGEAGGPGAAREDEFSALHGRGRPGEPWTPASPPRVTNAFHLIGKDISRFHCIIWPTVLLAAGATLPRQVYVHGFITTRGEKLSKSLGTRIDPVEMARIYGVDTLRFYILHAIPTGRDGEFTLEQFVEHCNAQLANNLGNLASRTVQMVHKYFAGRTPETYDPATLTGADARAALDALATAARAAAESVPRGFRELRINEALAEAWVPVERANEFIERVKPWALAKDEARRAELATALNALLETLRLVAIWSWPAIPTKSEALWRTLALPGSPAEARGAAAQPNFAAPSPQRALGERESLFPRLEIKAEAT